MKPNFDRFSEDKNRFLDQPDSGFDLAEDAQADRADQWHDQQVDREADVRSSEAD